MCVNLPVWAEPIVLFAAPLIVLVLYIVLTRTGTVKLEDRKKLKIFSIIFAIILTWVSFSFSFMWLC